MFKTGGLLPNVAALVYCSLIGYTGVVIFRWVEIRRLTYSSYPNFSEIGVAVLCGFPLVLMHRICQQMMLPVAVRVVPRKDKWSIKVYESKLHRFGSSVYKFIFFVSFSTYFYWHALVYAKWMPPSMFGYHAVGSTMHCWGEGNAGDTQEPIGTAMTRFYQVALAYHMSELAFQIIYEREKPDFLEMLIHHATTLFLVFASFLANFVRIGSLVLFVHYVSDIPVYGTKIFVDTRCGVLTACWLLGVLISWGYLRLYVFPMFLIRSTLLESALERATLGNLAYYTFNAALSVLVCLHLYWYYALLSMGWYYLNKGETRDTQTEKSS